MRPVRWVYNNTAVKVYQQVPAKYRQWLAALGTLAIVCIGAFVPAESLDNTRANRAISIAGLIIFIGILYASSNNRSKIPWHTVIGGELCQFIIAVFVLKITAGYDIFNFISFLARAFLGYAGDGLAFLTDEDALTLGWFITGVLPAIIFFIAVTQCLYHLKILQWLVIKFASFFFWTLRVSGAEAVVAAASPFLGQGESAILIRPYIPYLTKAEIHQIMCSGFATIAGSVLAGYISLGLNPQVLVSSCIMSIPASLAVSKLRYPETEDTLTSGHVSIPEDEEEKSANVLHAFTKGSWLGIKIGGAIVAVLLSIVALVALVNGLLGWWGKYVFRNPPPSVRAFYRY
jgi:concentrative nucleoside transporter, CNT family